MGNGIETVVSGIKCDTEGCSYRDDAVTVEDYVNWVNRPCPECGGNLLTKEDYDYVRLLIEFTKTMNSLAPATDDDEERVVVRVETDGTGNVGITIKPEEDREGN